MRARGLWIVLAAVSLTGCPDSGLKPGDGGNDFAMSDLAGTGDFSIPDDFRVIVLPSQFQKDLAAAICAHFQMCGRLDPANLTACIEAQTVPLPVNLDDEAMKGRLQINEDQCIAAVMGARCDGEDSGLVFIQKCANLLFIPKEPSNGSAACIASTECINGWCSQTGTLDGGVIAPQGCAGICQPYETTGTACDSTDESRQQCGTMGFCDPSTNKCVALAGLGADCSSINCQSNLFCDILATGGPKCAMPMATGTTQNAPCNAFQNLGVTPTCGPTFYCNYSQASMAFTGCQPKIPQGQPCDTSTFFATLDNACADGNTCFKVSMAQTTCQPYGAVGAACDSSDNCQSTLYCDPTTMKCKALIADGAACNAGNPNGYCLSGSNAQGVQHCINNVCVPEKGFGDQCNPTTDDAICGGPPAVCDPASMRCAPQCM